MAPVGGMLGVVSADVTANGSGQLCTLREASEQLGLSLEGLRHRIKAGSLGVAGRRPGHGVHGVVLVDLDDVKAAYETSPARPSTATSASNGHGREEDLLRDDQEQHAERDGVTGACEQLAAVLAGEVLRRVDDVLADRAVELDALAQRRRQAAEQAEQQLEAATQARRVAEQEARRLQLTRAALSARRHEMLQVMSGRE